MPNRDCPPKSCRWISVKIAIVEDDAATSDILATWINAAPNHDCVGQFGDVASALAALPERAPDVALVDINLPDLSGMECVRQLKPRLPQTQFIMVTVYGDAEHIFEALAAGASGYLFAKPASTREKLLAALQEVHGGRDR